MMMNIAAAVPPPALKLTSSVDGMMSKSRLFMLTLLFLFAGEPGDYPGCSKRYDDDYDDNGNSGLHCHGILLSLCVLMG